MTSDYDEDEQNPGYDKYNYTPHSKIITIDFENSHGYARNLNPISAKFTVKTTQSSRRIPRDLRRGPVY